ncbi:hypothetical protein CRYUN_Cryun04dG0077100 [Craigia yunnanensis]
MESDNNDNSFSWDDKRAGTKVLLSKNILEKSSTEFQLYKSHSDNYICPLIPGTFGFQAQYTPAMASAIRAELTVKPSSIAPVISIRSWLMTPSTTAAPQ